ncbi:MAG: efflux transporter outer membrane subunit [Pseudomonadota bacterium]|nr:efflux transporter outer membrane subunit [Pseudomonadota bacterium]
MSVVKSAVRALSFGAAGALLSACAVGPDFEKPARALPETLGPTLEEGEGGRLADVAWFELFADETLDALIEEALEENIDLRTALGRVLEARARLGISRAGLFPNTFATLDSTLAPTERDDTSHALGVGLSWEIDVFGKLRRTREAAEAELLASEDGARAVTVTLVSSVSGTYYAIREVDRLISIVEQTITSQEASLKLVRDQLASGIVSAAEESQALALLASTRASLPALRAQRIAAQNALSVLLGRVPDRTLVARRDDPQAPGLPAFTVGLPTELLAERPDVRAAEQRLHAATARVGVAIANRFPFATIGLTGFAGNLGADLDDVFDGQDVFSWGPTAAVPIIDFGRTRLGVDVADAQVIQAAEAYRLAVLNALREVSDALASLEAAEEIIGHNRVREGATREALRLQRSRFKQGVVADIEVLDAERQHLAAQQALARADYGSVQSFLVLYRALGGGADEARLQETLAALDAEE